MDEEGLLWDVGLCQAGPSSALASQERSLSTRRASVLPRRHASPFQVSLCLLQRKKGGCIYTFINIFKSQSTRGREGGA